MDINLFNYEKGNYAACYEDHVLEQYKALVETTDRVSDRRLNSNICFTAINSALLTVYSTLDKLNLSQKIIIFIIGLLISLIWYLTIKSYRYLNESKFKIIDEIEHQLPLSIFTYEWSLLNQGKFRKRYLPLTKIENIIPAIFALVYVTIFAISILNNTPTAPVTSTMPVK